MYREIGTVHHHPPQARGLIYMLAAFRAKVHLQVTEQSLREEYKRKTSEAYEVIKRLQHHPQVSISQDCASICCNYFVTSDSCCCYTCLLQPVHSLVTTMLL